MKEQLIKFLQAKATAFSVDEVNGMIQLISKLEEPKKEEVKETKKK